MAIDKADPGQELHLNQIVKRHHKRLTAAGVTVGLEFASRDGGGAAIVQGGMAVKGQTKISGAAARRWGAPDAIVRLDKGVWEAADGKEKSALLDHFLTGIQIVEDTAGGAALDKHGRPRLKRRPYDFCVAGYDEVIERHGMDAAPEARAIREAAGACKQLTLAFTAGPILPPDGEGETEAA